MKRLVTLAAAVALLSGCAVQQRDPQPVAAPVQQNPEEAYVHLLTCEYNVAVVWRQSSIYGNQITINGTNYPVDGGMKKERTVIAQLAKSASGHQVGVLFTSEMLAANSARVYGYKVPGNPKEGLSCVFTAHLKG